MPPFAGNAADVEALVQLIRWELAGAPKAMAAAESRDPAVLDQIDRWLREAGTAPAAPRGAH